MFYPPKYNVCAGHCIFTGPSGSASSLFVVSSRKHTNIKQNAHNKKPKQFASNNIKKLGILKKLEGGLGVPVQQASSFLCSVE